MVMDASARQFPRARPSIPSVICACVVMSVFAAIGAASNAQSPPKPSEEPNPLGTTAAVVRDRAAYSVPKTVTAASQPHPATAQQQRQIQVFGPTLLNPSADIEAQTRREAAHELMLMSA